MKYYCFEVCSSNAILIFHKRLAFTGPEFSIKRQGKSSFSSDTFSLKLTGRFSFFKVPKRKYRSKRLKSYALQKGCYTQRAQFVSTIFLQYSQEIMLGHFPARNFPNSGIVTRVLLKIKGQNSIQSYVQLHREILSILPIFPC